MRRMLRTVALALLIALAVDWAPGMPPTPLLGVAQTRGQSVAPIPAFGTMIYSGASVTAVNTANEVSAFQYIIPAGFTASATTVGAVGSDYFVGDTATGFKAPVLWGVPQPMHLRMVGTIAAAAAANINIGINFGTAVTGAPQTVASVTLNPTIPGAITAPPLLPTKLDLWITPLASGTATPNSPNSNNVMIYAQWSLPLGGPLLGNLATQSVLSTMTIANINMASPNVLNVVMRWGAASNANSLSWLGRILRIGE
jgi:hypothetical protein